MGEALELARGRRRGLELTPAEIALRRRNRGWLFILFSSPLAILVGALIATGIAQPNQPSAPHPAAPPGYETLDDGYFSSAVPSAWSNNPAYTDQAGDTETSGPGGWAAEHLDFRSRAPTAPEQPPAVLDSFGMPRPEPFHLGPPTPIDVPGAGAAYEYRAVRPGGWSATVVDAWDSRQGVEIWLVVHSTPATTSRIVASLNS